MGFQGDSTGFWLAGGLILGGVAVLLLASLYMARRLGSAPALQPDLQLYREQLQGIERDLGRGILEEAEAARLKTEVARRLLDADRAAQATEKAVKYAASSQWVASLVILACLGLSLVIYHRLGAPGYADMPLSARIEAADLRIASRPSQEAYAAGLPPQPPTGAENGASADFAPLMDQLRAAVDPSLSEDLTGLELLARNEATLGNYPAARAAQERIIALKSDIGSISAADHMMLAEILIAETGGYISPEAEGALAATLRLNPREGLAHYYTGMLFAQGGRFDRAFALWQPLMAVTRADDSWAAALSAQIGDVAELAGVRYEPPALQPAAAPAGADLPGPDAAAIAAMEGASPEEQQAMAGAMVARLGARLASEGGSAGEWARLIQSLSVLDRKAEAGEILAEAREIFKDGPARAEIDAAAAAAGLAGSDAK